MTSRQAAPGDNSRGVCNYVRPSCERNVGSHGVEAGGGMYTSGEKDVEDKEYHGEPGIEEADIHGNVEVMRRPYALTKQELAGHIAAHLPFRELCPPIVSHVGGFQGIMFEGETANTWALQSVWNIVSWEVMTDAKALHQSW